tara:strand:+ start:2603 stop:2812 length:210 start_codon:yes stop_codon:yes gene_type:complete
VHLLAGLTAYIWQEKQPALSWTKKDWGNPQSTQRLPKTVAGIAYLKPTLINLNSFLKAFKIKNQLVQNK